MTLTNPTFLVDGTTFSGKNIATAASVYQYTAAADGIIYISVAMTVAGNGDYVAYITHKWLAAGSTYTVLPKTTGTATVAETTISFISGPIIVKNTDVIDIMIDGLAGDINIGGIVRIAYYNFSVFQSADPVTLSTTQGAITWGQQKIVANAANEGALDIRNANADGIGTYNQGGDVGLYNDGTALYGQYNVGADTGLYNNGTGVGAYGNYNVGVAIGQYNAGSGAASAGQTNQGVVDGQFNTGGTYGQQNTGASGQVNVGTAGDGIYASGTDHGIEASGTTSALNPAILADFFTVDSGETSATAIDGSVVKEIMDGICTPTVFPAGAINFTYTVTDAVTTLPIEGVEVWISTDNPAVNIVWKGDTDAFGVARDVNGDLPALDAGVYNFWRQKAGYTFTDPDVETVS